MAAAKHQFAELGYPRTTLRAVAREADVDTRLVTHYFGSKQNLFISVVDFPFDPDQLADELTDEQIAGFLDTAEGTSRFAEELRAARDRRAADDAPAARGHLRAL